PAFSFSARIGSSWLAGVSCMRPTSGSRSPNVSRSAPSAAEADTRPSSKASAGPTLASSMPLPTSARNSGRLRSDMVGLPGGTGSGGRRSPAPVVEEIDRTVILATQLINNAAALHDRLGKAWAVSEASTCSLRAAVTDSAESLRGLLGPPAGGPHGVWAGGFLTPILHGANLDVQNRRRAPRRPHRPAQRASACRSDARWRPQRARVVEKTEARKSPATVGRDESFPAR